MAHYGHDPGKFAGDEKQLQERSTTTPLPRPLLPARRSRLGLTELTEDDDGSDSVIVNGHALGLFQ